MLIFAVRQPPYPTTYGAAIRTHRLLTGLAEAFPVTLLTFEHEPGAEGHVPAEELRSSLPGVEVITVPGLPAGKRRAQARSLLSRRSWQWGRYRSPAYGALLQRTVEALNAPIVHFDDLGVAGFAPARGPLSVFAPHNVEHRILREASEAARGLRGAFATIESHKVEREELRAWRRAGLCLAVSPIDAAAMRAGGARRVELCPNGADPVQPLPFPHRGEDEPLRLLFVGTASYQPYERGLRWFVTEVLPPLRARVPVELDVVGAPPRRPAAVPGVGDGGTGPDLAEWYERAHAVVVPVFEGSGTRLKVVEALAYGRPVVSTPLGAEGLPVRAGGHYVEAADAACFVRALADLAVHCGAGDPRLESMIERRRRVVAPLLWPNIVANLVALYQEEIDRRGSGPKARS